MRSRKLSAHLAIAGTVVAALVLGVTPVAQARPAVAGVASGPSVPNISWSPCPLEVAEPPLECATMAVPLDHRAPRGRTIDLALVRFPASNPANRIGSLFINPGGPGGSGVDTVIAVGADLDADMQGRFDIVGFDPRGIARSAPVRCWPTFDQALNFAAGVPIFPYESAMERPFFAELTTLYPSCLANGQRDIMRFMGTADVARDLDLMRRAVGDQKLNYLGFSYGSFLGNTYANLFPRNIRALAIDGVLDPRLWSSGRQIESDRTAGEVVMAEFLRLCDEAACPFSGPHGAAARWTNLLAVLREAPVTIELPPDPPFELTYDLLVAVMFGGLYSASYWPDYAILLDYIDQAVSSSVPGGDPAVMKELATRWAALTAKDPVQEPYDNFVEGYYGNHCADAEYPSSLRDWSKTGRFAAKDSVFGPYLWWTQAPCANWPVSPTRYGGPWTARTSAPVLVVGNSFDPATDLAGAQATARLLPNSRLLTYAGWGHVAYFVSECARTYTAAYLVSGALPPRGTVCPANPNPFLVVPGPVRASGGAGEFPLAGQWQRPTR